MIPPFSHILVIRSSAMGDVAMTIPVLLAFREAYPTVKITVLTKAFFTPFFTTIPNVKVKIFETETTHKGILGIRKLSQELKQEGIDAIVDLHNVLRTQILKKLLLFSEIPFVQMDKGRKEKKALTRWENKIFKPLKSTHQRYVDTFKTLGYILDISSKKYILEKQTLPTEAQNIIGNNSKKWIGIAPFAKHKGKTYPLRLIKEVINALDKTNNYKIILFGGGAKETKILNLIEQNHQNVISIASKIKFEEELHLISNLDVMISMDSGNGHLAAMYGIPLIIIWGITHPFAGFNPYNQLDNNNILSNLDKYPKIPTSIYGNKFPKGYEKVMSDIPSKVIVQKIISTLN